ncbi:MAG: tetratricopeptide repeat protein [bacterium]
MKQSMLGFAFGIIFLSSLTLSTKSQSQEAEAAKLRSMYFNRDYEGGAIRGQEWGAQLLRHDELRAWFILNMARNDLAAQAVAAADEMIATGDSSPWSWFALAGALNWSRERREEALPASKKALLLLPDHPDVIWMRAETLMRQGKEEQAIDFVDKNRAKLANPAELVATKGNAIYSLWGRDEDKFEQALHTFAKARQMDPSNVSAHVIPAVYLSRKGRNEEALPLLKKALVLAPNSTGIHERYWQAIWGIKNMASEVKRKEIESDIEPFLQNRGDYPGALQAVSTIYRELKLFAALGIIREREFTFKINPNL